MPSSSPDALPVVVIGAGAAGLAAGNAAATGGARTLLLERTPDGGRKILVSGGGRCNVLPVALEPGRFVTDSSPNTLRKLLTSWPLAEQRAFFEREVGVALALEAETGKLFPVSNRARDVRDGLIDLARRRGVEIRTRASVVDLEPPLSPGAPWRVLLEGGEPIAARAVVLAAGGLSLPGTGSDGTGLAIARRLGLGVVEPYPALTPLTGGTGPGQESPHASLAGISLNVRIGAPGTKRSAEGGFLFTHRGWSGPAVLDLSDLAVRSRLAEGPRRELRIRWTAWNEAEWDAALRADPKRPGATAIGTVRRQLPERLAEWLLSEAGVEGSTSLGQLRREERRRLVEILVRYPLPWTGDEGYRKAEVTGGGVALGEIDPRTLECRRRPGLFLCGEILDAFGPIGGHNFAWAWATGRAAGRGAAGFGG